MDEAFYTLLTLAIFFGGSIALYPLSKWLEKHIPTAWVLGIRHGTRYKVDPAIYKRARTSAKVTSARKNNHLHNNRKEGFVNSERG